MADGEAELMTSYSVTSLEESDPGREVQGSKIGMRPSNSVTMREVFPSRGTTYSVIHREEAGPESMGPLEGDMTEVTMRLEEVTVHLTTKLTVLEATIIKWTECYKKLNEFCDWLKEMEERMQNKTKSPNEELDKAKAISTQLHDKHFVLEEVEKDAKCLRENFTSTETTTLMSKLALIRHQWESLCSHADHHSSALTESVVHWQTYQDLSLQFMPWIVKAEIYCSMELPTCSSFEEASDLYDLHRRFLSKLKTQVSIFEKMHTEQLLVMDHLNTLLDMDDLHSRLNRILQMSEERRIQVDKLYSVWTTYNVQLTNVDDVVDNADLGLNDEGNFNLTDPRVLEHELAVCKNIQKGLIKQTGIIPVTQPWKSSTTMEENTHKSTEKQTTEMSELGNQTPDFSELTKRLENIAVHLTAKLYDLEATIVRWTEYYRRLKQFCAWLNEMEEKLNNSDSKSNSPEDELNDVKAIVKQVNENQTALQSLETDAKDLYPKFISEDTAALRSKLIAMRRQWESLRSRSQYRKSVLTENVAHWKNFLDLSQQFMPWVIKAEMYCHMELPKCSSIGEANDLQDLHQKFLHKCESQAPVFENMNSKTLHTMDQLNIVLDLDDLQQRLNQILHMSEERRLQVDSLLSTWISYNQQLSSIDKATETLEMRLKQEPKVHSTDPQILKHELALCKTLQDEIQSLGPQLQTLQSHFERIRHYITPDVERDLKRSLDSLTERWKRLHSEVIQRQDHLRHTKGLDDRLEDFALFLRNLQRKMDNSSEIFSDEIEGTIENNKRLQHECDEAESYLNTLAADFEDQTTNCNEDEAAILSDRFYRLRNAFNQLKDSIDARKEVCEKLRKIQHEHQDTEDRIRTLNSTNNHRQQITEDEMDNVGVEIGALKRRKQKTVVQNEHLDELMATGQLTIKDRKTQRALYFGSDFQSLKSVSTTFLFPENNEKWPVNGVTLEGQRGTYLGPNEMERHRGTERSEKHLTVKKQDIVKQNEGHLNATQSEDSVKFKVNGNSDIPDDNFSNKHGQEPVLAKKMNGYMGSDYRDKDFHVRQSEEHICLERMEERDDLNEFGSRLDVTVPNDINDTEDTSPTKDPLLGILNEDHTYAKPIDQQSTINSRKPSDTTMSKTNSFAEEREHSSKIEMDKYSVCTQTDLCMGDMETDENSTEMHIDTHNSANEVVRRSVDTQTDTPMAVPETKKPSVDTQADMNPDSVIERRECSTDTQMVTQLGVAEEDRNSIDTQTDVYTSIPIFDKGSVDAKTDASYSAIEKAKIATATQTSKCTDLNSVDTQTDKYTDTNSVDTQTDKYTDLNSADTQTDKYTGMCSVDTQTDRPADISSIDTQTDQFADISSVDTQTDKPENVNTVDTQTDKYAYVNSNEAQTDTYVNNSSVDTQTDRFVSMNSVDTQTNKSADTSSVNTQTDRCAFMSSVDTQTGTSKDVSELGMNSVDWLENDKNVDFTDSNNMAPTDIRIDFRQPEEQLKFTPLDERSHISPEDEYLLEHPQRWGDFEEKKAELIRKLVNIESMIESAAVEEPSLRGVKELLKNIEDIRDEVSTYNPDEEQLRELGCEIQRNDPSKGSAVKGDLGQVSEAWYRIQKLLRDKYQYLTNVAAHWQLYKDTKAGVVRTLDDVEPIVDEKVIPTRQPKVKRSPLAPDRLKNAEQELDSKKGQLDKMNSFGLTLREDLRKIPGFDVSIMEMDLDEVNYRWEILNQKIQLKLREYEFNILEEELISKIRDAERTVVQQQELLSNMKIAEPMLKEHNSILQESGVVPVCEQCLNKMKTLTTDLKISPEEDASLQARYTELLDRWEKLKSSMEVMTLKLKNAREECVTVGSSLHLEGTERQSRHQPFFSSYFRRSFPLHLLFILLLIFAKLVLVGIDDCCSGNTFRNSFQVMMTYTDGPPPI